MSDCIFCKIVAGEIPAAKIYEDDQVLAFLDISQTTKGHSLIIPKNHVRNFLEMMENQAESLFKHVPRLSKKLQKATGAKGMNVVSNAEEIAGQTVFHAHIHLIPRYNEADEFALTFTSHEPDFAALAKLAQEITEA